MDEPTGFTMTFDVALESLFHMYNPLRGPIVLDYLVGKNADFPAMVLAAYQNKNLGRETRLIDTQIIKFWQMVDDWMVPTKVHVVDWVRALMGHCCAMQEVFQFKASVLEDPKIFYDGVVRLCRGLFGARSILKGTEGEETAYVEAYKRDGHKAAIDLWERCVIEEDESDYMQKRVDLRTTEGREFIKYLYVHVCRGAELIHNLSQEKGAEAMASLMSDPDKYEDMLGTYVDTGPSLSKFLRYPSLIRPMAHFDPKRIPLNLNNMDIPDDAARENRWAAYLFYSGVQMQGRMGLGEIFDDYIARRVAGQTFSDTHNRKFHDGFRPSVDGDSMEHYNYEGFRQLVGRGPLRPLLEREKTPRGEAMDVDAELHCPEHPEEESYDYGFFWIVGGLGLAGALFLNNRKRD